MKWWSADHLKGKDNGLPLSTRNPWSIYDEGLKFAATGKWTGSEQYAGVDVKVLETTGDAAQLDALLNLMVKGNVAPWDGIPDWDWLAVKDAAKSSVTYKLWIGKEDLRIWRMESRLTMGIDQKKKPEQDLPAKIEMIWSFDVSDYDKSLEVTVPAEVRGRLGLKENP